MDALPAVLVLSDEGPQTGTAGGLLLHRLFSGFPAERLRVFTRYMPTFGDPLPNVVYRRLLTPWRRFERSRFNRLKRSLRAYGIVPQLSIRMITDMLEGFAPDVVFCVMQHACYYETAWHFARHKQLPLVVAVHDVNDEFEPVLPWARAAIRRRDARFYRYASCRLCISPEMEQFCRDRYGVTGSVLYPNVTVYDNVDIGRGAVLHSGAVIGADGFGYVMEHDRWHKFPQVGRVEIGDFVEIGANSCVDRAALGVTEIGEGTKLDNMVHVAHNCRIGKHVVVAAQTGFSGGVVVEDYAVIGGQVGIGDKARIESRAVLGSGCGVLTSKIVRSGETVWGTPARPLKQHLEQLANLARLPELRREVAELKRRLAELEGKE